MLLLSHLELLCQKKCLCGSFLLTSIYRALGTYREDADEVLIAGRIDSMFGRDIPENLQLILAMLVLDETQSAEATPSTSTCYTVGRTAWPRNQHSGIDAVLNSTAILTCPPATAARPLTLTRLTLIASTLAEAGALTASNLRNDFDIVAIQPLSEQSFQMVRHQTPNLIPDFHTALINFYVNHGICNVKPVYRCSPYRRAFSKLHE